MDPKSKPGMSVEERRFVEALGIALEGWGGSRMAGRIFGALLLSNSPEISSSQLARSLGISNGSVSMATRELMTHGLIERVGVPGERQGYFRTTLGADRYGELIRDSGKSMRQIQLLLEQGQELLKDKDPEVLKRFEELNAFVGFFEKELEQMHSHWEEHLRSRS